jgi:hypothetical protein
MRESTSIEYGGVRIDLAHVNETSRLPMLAEARAWIEKGQRPPLLTVRNGGIDVSEHPEHWPDAERNYRGRGRLEWVGHDSNLSA